MMMQQRVRSSRTRYGGPGTGGSMQGWWESAATTDGLMGGSAERRSSKPGTEKLRVREEVRGAPGPGEEARGAPVHSWLHPACLASLFRLGSNIVRRLALISLPSPRRLGLPHWVDDVS